MLDRSTRCSTLVLGRIVIGGFVQEVGRITEHHETVGKTGRHPSWRWFSALKLDTDPLAECRRRFSNVHGNVEHRPLHHAHQLALGLLDLIMQATQHPFRAAAVIVLHKMMVGTVTSLSALVEALEKNPRASPNTLGSISTTSGMARPGSLHRELNRFFRSKCASDTSHNHSWSMAHCQALQLRGIDPPMAPRDFLGAGDFQSLPILKRGDELTRLEQAFMRAGVQPGIAAAHDFHLQQALFEVQPVQVGDLQLAARRGWRPLASSTTCAS